MQRWMWLAALCLVSTAAEAGKKKKKDEEGVKIEAPSGGEMIGRPAGVDFAEVGCPFEAGTTHTWTRTRDGVVRTLSLETTKRDARYVDFRLRGEVDPATLTDPLAAEVERRMPEIEPFPLGQYDGEGAQLGIMNLDAYVPAHHAAVLAALDAIQADQALDVTPAQRKQLLDRAQSAPAVRTALLAELMPLFQYSCGSLALGDTTYLGQAVTPAKTQAEFEGKITIRRVDPQTLSVKVVEDVTPEAIIEGAKPMYGGNIPPEQLAEMQAMGISRTVEASVAVDTGIVTRLQATTVMKAADGGKTESTEIVYVPAP